MGFEKTVLNQIEEVAPTVDAHFANGTLFLENATDEEVQTIVQGLKDVVSCRMIVNSRPKKTLDEVSIDFA
jgi:hypothetical protein